MTFGQKIRYLRKFCRLTQTEVAQAIGIAQTTFGQVERGHRPLSFLELKRFNELIDKSEGMRQVNLFHEVVDDLNNLGLN